MNSRMESAVLRRIGWQSLSRGIPEPLGKIVRKKIWKWPYRHMRSYPWHLGQLEHIRPGSWKISVDGAHVTTTVPLSEWIGRIDRPVTIVAAGPSAREHDLGELAAGERMIVAVNGVPALLADRGIRPDVWIASDPRIAKMILANFQYAPGTPLVVPASVAALLAASAPEELASRAICVIERVNQWHGASSLDREKLHDLNIRSGRPFLFPESGQGKSVIGWSHRPELGIFSGCTVAFAALQIVIGMGARDIEIIGMDLTSSGHAYEEKEGPVPTTLDDDYEHRILPSFALMAEALQGTGVKVSNLSPVCRLPRHYFAG